MSPQSVSSARIHMPSSVDPTSALVVVFRTSCARVSRSEETLDAFSDLLKLTGGDFTKGDGTGTFSIYGDKFPVSPNYPGPCFRH